MEARPRQLGQERPERQPARLLTTWPLSSGKPETLLYPVSPTKAKGIPRQLKIAKVRTQIFSTHALNPLTFPQRFATSLEVSKSCCYFQIFNQCICSGQDTPDITITSPQKTPEGGFRNTLYQHLFTNLRRYETTLPPHSQD